MMRFLLLALCVLLAMGIIGGCERADEQPAVAVPTPKMPDGWKVVEDFQVSPTQLKEFSARMNADLHGIRNTSFEVEGLRIKVNTIIAATAADAEKAMSYMKGIKSEQALLLRELTIYELVGTTEVNHLIPVARQHLETL